jgi:heme/copper-type cytochrome/quinol oxidase subunit 1
MERPLEDDAARRSTDTPQNEALLAEGQQGEHGHQATLLGSFDVFSLIVNKMIGTGIYTAPTTVLLLTGDKQLSLGLWAVGFVFTIMRCSTTGLTGCPRRLTFYSMIIYLDYAAVFPYTGGEIVYVCLTLKRWRNPAH